MQNNIVDDILLKKHLVTEKTKSMSAATDVNSTTHNSLEHAEQIEQKNS